MLMCRLCIVVGTHGRRGFSKFFLGSVAERVIATAPCPVMTVRGKKAITDVLIQWL